MSKPQSGSGGKPAKDAAVRKTGTRAAASISTKKPVKKRRRAPKPAALTYHPGPLIDCAETLGAAVAGLKAADPGTISHMLELGGPTPLRLRKPGLEGLLLIVISQQVSVASADAIAARVRKNIAPLDAATINALSDDQLRACGLSGPKMRTFRALSKAILTGGLDLDALAGMGPEEAHQAMIKVKGIGPWTADIFLLFCLGHPDAWPAGDLALQEAARIALGMKTRPDAKKLGKIGERWRPWRGVAARILWAYYRVAKMREGMAMAAK